MEKYRERLLVIKFGSFNQADNKRFRKFLTFKDYRQVNLVDMPIDEIL
jgi:hypothetical protein